MSCCKRQSVRFRRATEAIFGSTLSLDQPQCGGESLLSIPSVDPMHIALRAEPGHLPLRIRPRPALGFGDCVLQRQLAGHNRDRLPIPDRRKRLRAPRIRTEESLRFIDQARGIHLLDAAIQRRRQRLTIKRESDLDRRPLALPFEFRDRSSAGHPHFQRALHSVTIGRSNPFTTLRIDSRQPTMKSFRSTLSLSDSPDPGTQVLVAAGHLRQSSQQSAQIKEGAADQNGYVPSSEYL